VRGLAIPAHAKLNLDLAVLGIRPDGFHEIKSTFQAVSLHDLLLIEPAGRTTLEGGAPDDLVLRAHRALETAAGRSLPARYRLIKRIPAGAGLGGGSSDAAAALRGLCRLHGLHADLTPIAAAIGADVAFFLAGGAAVATGRGETVRPTAARDAWYSIAWPGFSLATPAVYRAWDEVGGAGVNHLARAAAAVEPKLAEFKRMLGEGWLMTGSGSAFFRAWPSRQEAEQAVHALGCWTVVASPVGPWSR
jgi:4-diphosphocytidyl-2-C-methyl-D-erythritol kinase